MKKLDIGCGSSKRAGYIGLDQLALPGVDIIHDLNTFPYPFLDNEVDEVWMDQVLEHVNDPLKVMEEIHRICKNGAKVFIGVPYFRSFYAFGDPTHRNFFGINWFNYLDPEHTFCKKYRYSNATFRVDKIEFDREFREKGKIGRIQKLFLKIADKNPEFYEERLSHLYPLSSLTYYVTVIK